MNKNLYLFLFIILSIFLLSNIAENSRLKNKIENYDQALNEANDNIEICNSSIENAQGYTWSTYEDMGQALESLETVDTISNP